MPECQLIEITAAGQASSMSLSQMLQLLDSGLCSLMMRMISTVAAISCFFEGSLAVPLIALAQIVSCRIRPSTGLA